MTLAIIDASETQYVIVAAGAELIATYVAQARAAGEDAQDVLDAILAAGLSEGVFPSLAAGESGTTDGQYFWVGDGGTVTLYLNDSGTGDEIAELATAAGLALKASIAELASPTGGEMVGTPRDNTVSQELTWARAAAPASLDEFYDASNGAAADRMALEAALASGRAVSFRGSITLDQTVTMPSGAVLIGEGSSADDNTAGKSTIIRGFTGSTPLFVCGPYSLVRDMDFDGDEQGTGDNIQITGFRAVLQNVSSRKAGRDNYRIGADGNDPLNANCWQMFNVRSYAAGRHGIFIHHTRETSPPGMPDVNGGSIFGGDVVRSGGDGIKIGNAIDNKFFGLTIQESSGRNIHLDDGAKGHVFIGPYSEAGGDVDLFATGTARNVYAWNRSNVVSSGLTDSGTGNMVIGSNSNMVPDQFGFMERLSIYAGTSPSLDLYGEGSLFAQLQSRTSGVGSGGQGVALAKRPGDSPIEVFRWLNTGIDVLAGNYLHGGTKVVGAQGAAVADATDAATVITQLNALLARLRTHGLIAP